MIVYTLITGSLFYINGGFPSRATYLLFRKAQDVGNYSISHAKDYSRVAAAVYRNTIQNEKIFFEIIEQKRDFIKATTLEVSMSGFSIKVWVH